MSLPRGEWKFKRMRRGPKPIAEVLSELMARRGLGRVQSTAAYEEAWREAAGPLVAEYTRISSLRRGRLEVIAANSILMQELVYQKAELLATLARLLPDQGIKDLRFRVGVVD